MTGLPESPRQRDIMTQVQVLARNSSQEQQKTQSESKASQEKGLETRLYVPQVPPERPTDMPRQQETGLGPGKPMVLHMLKSQVRVSGQLRPSRAVYLALTGTRLSSSEQNATAVSKANFVKPHRVVFTGMKPVDQENYQSSLLGTC